MRLCTKIFLIWNGNTMSNKDTLGTLRQREIWKREILKRVKACRVIDAERLLDGKREHHKTHIGIALLVAEGSLIRDGKYLRFPKTSS